MPLNRNMWRSIWHTPDQKAPDTDDRTWNSFMQPSHLYFNSTQLLINLNENLSRQFWSIFNRLFNKFYWFLFMQQIRISSSRYKDVHTIIMIETQNAKERKRRNKTHAIVLSCCDCLRVKWSFFFFKIFFLCRYM